MSVNSVTFVAPNLAWGEARGASARAPASIPRQWGCDRRATKPQAKFGATLRAAVLFGPGGVARSLQIRVGYALVPVRKHLAPCRGRKLLAANVTEFTLMTTKFAADMERPWIHNKARMTNANRMPKPKCQTAPGRPAAVDSYPPIHQRGARILPGARLS